MPDVLRTLSNRHVFGITQSADVIALTMSNDIPSTRCLREGQMHETKLDVSIQIQIRKTGEGNLCL